MSDAMFPPALKGTYISEDERTIVRLTDENRQLRVRVAELRRSEERLTEAVLLSTDALQKISSRLDEMIAKATARSLTD